MIRKALMMMAVVAFSLGGVAVTAPAQSAPTRGSVAQTSDQHPQARRTESCKGRYRTAHTSVNDGTTGNDEWYLKAAIHYTYCRISDGHDRVQGPYWVTVGYNQEGTHMDCGIGANNRLTAVEFKGYYWDAWGHNWDRDTIKLGCDDSTTNVDTIQYEGEKMWTDGKRAPKAKWNVRGRKEGLGNDFYATLSLTFRNCDGEENNPC